MQNIIHGHRSIKQQFELYFLLLKNIENFLIQTKRLTQMKTKKYFKFIMSRFFGMVQLLFYIAQIYAVSSQIFIPCYTAHLILYSFIVPFSTGLCLTCSSKMVQHRSPVVSNICINNSLSFPLVSLE